VFETIQVIRDHDDDRNRGIGTTAVRLGPRRALLAAKVFMIVSALYGLAVLHRYAALLQLAAPLVPFASAAPGVYWTRVRLVLGLSWLAALVWVFWTGSTWGWAVEIQR
jgi:4-hydroxybenzoate polyprenyltransferase